VEEIALLNDALKILKGEVEDGPAPELHPSEEQAPKEIKEMEEAFTIASHETKNRQKHLKALIRSAFFSLLNSLKTASSKNIVSFTLSSPKI
jgi:hypothetical protein